MTKSYSLRWLCIRAIGFWHVKKRPLRNVRGLASKAPYAPQSHPRLVTPPQTERFVRFVWQEDVAGEQGEVLAVCALSGAGKDPRHWRNQLAPGSS